MATSQTGGGTDPAQGSRPGSTEDQERRSGTTPEQLQRNIAIADHWFAQARAWHQAKAAGQDPYAAIEQPLSVPPMFLEDKFAHQFAPRPSAGPAASTSQSLPSEGGSMQHAEVSGAGAGRGDGGSVGGSDRAATQPAAPEDQPLTHEKDQSSTGGAAQT
ncbi:g7244 [Coccomyxa viridis]|uniref:G7244 protein n=1 Tax=Coccomyxa viridis TaxID=1274662 RepID=A0ABP1FXC8_9CHLO